MNRTPLRLGRRELVQAGALGLLGGLGSPFTSAAAERHEDFGPGFGRAKACIFLFMWGGPSHLDTLDPKPEAPDSVRGEFAAIDTAAPGIQIAETMPMTATVMDRLSVIRSLSHTDPAHLSSAHATVTGHWAPKVKSDADPPSPVDTPHMGSVMSRLRPPAGGLPAFVQMPWRVRHPAAPGGEAPGQHGGWLGRAHDAFMVQGDPSKPDWRIRSLSFPSGLSVTRLKDRRRLLAEIDGQRAALRSAAATAMTGDQRRAFSLLLSPEVRRAFDVHAEPDDVRDRYGRNIHGQSVLLARRLVEHGVPLVAVNWHDDRKNFWDTHGNNFNRIRKNLAPPADRALTTLILDLEQRGLLDETIIAWVGEFGRRPRIGNAGREHHPFCYSGLLGGGGIRGGLVHGRSDALGDRPAADPVSPRDYASTILHALGIPHDAVLHDRTERPHHLHAGKPILPLFG